MTDKLPISEEQALAKAASLLEEAKAWQDYARSVRRLRELTGSEIPAVKLPPKVISQPSTRQSGVGEAVVEAIRTAGRFVTVQQIADVIEDKGEKLTNLQVTKALWRLKQTKEVVAHPKATHYDRKRFTWGLPDFMDSFSTDDRVMSQHEPEED